MNLDVENVYKDGHGCEVLITFLHNYSNNYTIIQIMDTFCK